MYTPLTVSAQSPCAPPGFTRHDHTPTLSDDDQDTPYDQTSLATLAAFNPPPAIAEQIISDAGNHTISLHTIAARARTTVEALRLWLSRPEVAQRLDALEATVRRRTRIGILSELGNVTETCATVMERYYRSPDRGPSDDHDPRTHAVHVQNAANALMAARVLLYMQRAVADPPRAKHSPQAANAPTTPHAPDPIHTPHAAPAHPNTPSADPQPAPHSAPHPAPSAASATPGAPTPTDDHQAPFRLLPSLPDIGLPAPFAAPADPPHLSARAASALASTAPRPHPPLLTVTHNTPTTAPTTSTPHQPAHPDPDLNTPEPHEPTRDDPTSPPTPPTPSRAPEPTQVASPAQHPAPTTPHRSRDPTQP